MVLFLVLAGSSSVFAESAPRALDVVLVLDSSGSMKKTDPRDLRKEAAKLFISLLSAKDRVAVVEFSDSARVLSEFRITGSVEEKKAVLSAIGAIGSSGRQTDIHRGAVVALELLEKETASGQDRVVILMTDGKVDTGDTSRDNDTTRLLLEEMPGRYASIGATLHTMAFTRQSDIGLLEKIAFRAKGFMAVAETSDELQEAFLQFFGRLKKPEATPVLGDEFVLDDATSEATLVAKKASPDVEVGLVGPDGQRVDRFGEGTGFERFTTASYDMITIRNPKPGRWRIQFSHGDGNRVVLITDLKLSCSFDESFLSQGMVVPVEVFLTRGDELVNDPEMLSGLEVSMSLFGPSPENLTALPLADNGASPDSARDDGIFSGEFGPLEPGSYRLTTMVRGRTFSRVREVPFRVNAWWYTPSVAFDVENGRSFVRVGLETTLDNVNIDKLALAGEVEVTGGAEELEFVRASTGFRAELKRLLGAGRHDVSLRLRHELENGKAYWIHLPKQTLEIGEKKAEQAARGLEGGSEFWSSWLGASILLVGINAVLAGVVAAWRFRKNLIPARLFMRGKKGGSS